MKNIILFTILFIISSFNTIDKHIIIGDSQTPYIDSQSSDVTKSIWKRGIDVKWLTSKISSQNINQNVETVIICIGTNGAFSKQDNIKKLVETVKIKFPNSKLYVVQGSWGWGDNRRVKINDIKSYYKQFSDLDVIVLETAIGHVKDPHSNLQVYKKIGKEIDDLIK